MSTKGKSNLYGRGKRGKADNKIGYKYSKYMSSKNEQDHINRHGLKEMKLTANQYKARAVAFANKVDEVNHVSFVNVHGKTFKYSYSTKEFAIISKNGTVKTYFKMNQSKWKAMVKINENKQR